MGHREALVDGDALDLVEHGCVRRVQLVGAEDLAGAHDVQRDSALQQAARLDRRGVRAQDEAGVRRIDEEGVLHLPCGVIGPEVQRVEVQPLRLDLRAFGHFPSVSDEVVGDLLLQQLEGMAGPPAPVRSDGSVTSIASATSTSASRFASSSVWRSASARETRPRDWPTSLPAVAFSALSSAPIPPVREGERGPVPHVRDLRRLELLEVTGVAECLERGIDGRRHRGFVAGGRWWSDRRHWARTSAFSRECVTDRTGAPRRRGTV